LLGRGHTLRNGFWILSIGERIENATGCDVCISPDCGELRDFASSRCGP